MNTYLKLAVITAGLITGFTACTDDTAKTNLLAEMEKARPEFISTDSSLSGLQNFLNGRKDSLERVALNDPARKTGTDSILNEGEKDMEQLSALIAAHKTHTAGIDSLKTGLENGTLRPEEVQTGWNAMLEDHIKAQDYIKATMLLLLTGAQGEKQDSAQRKEEQKDILKVRNAPAK